jgi:O-antigen/teichoic acid export membrane protein
VHNGEPTCRRPELPTFGARLARLAVASGAASLVTLALSSLAGVALARHAGPADYAVFVAANMLVFLLAAACSFSAPLALSKEVALADEQDRLDAARPAIASILLTLTSTSAIAGIALVALLRPLEGLLDLHLGRTFAVLFPFALAASVIGDSAIAIYQALLRPARVGLIAVSGPLVLVGVVASRFFNSGVPLAAAALTVFLASGTVGIALLWHDGLLARPARRTTPLVARNLAPATAFTVVMVMTTWSDRLIVGTSLGAAGLGLFAAASVLLQAGLRVPTNLAYALVPASTRVADDDERAKRLAETVMVVLGSALAPGFLVLLFAGGPVVRLLFGHGFEPVVGPLRILAGTLLTAAVSIPMLSRLMASSQSQLLVGIVGATLPIRIALLATLTAVWDLDGAALAILITELGMSAALAVACRRLPSPPSVRAIFPVAGWACAAALAGGVASFSGIELVPVAIALAVFSPRVVRTGRQMVSVLR